MADVKTDRRQALDLAIASIDRQFGKGAIMRLGQNGAFDEIAVIPTGAMQLDVALGIGGIPRGRITEIYGPESSGKTTLALHIISEAQRMGGTAAFIDAEHALDPIYAKNLGVNTDELLISQPDTGEQALEIAETLVRSNAVDAIVIDSVAALVPRAELDGDMGDSLPGLQARLMSQALRKLTAAIARSGGSVIFINQIREKIGVMFGSPETTTGGRALEVLLLDPAGHPAPGHHQERHRGGRGPDQGQSREEQALSALPGGRVRRHLRRRGSPRKGRSWTWPRSTMLSKNPALGTPIRVSESVRAARTPSGT